MSIVYFGNFLPVHSSESHPESEMLDSDRILLFLAVLKIFFGAFQEHRKKYNKKPFENSLICLVYKQPKVDKNNDRT